MQDQEVEPILMFRVPAAGVDQRARPGALSLSSSCRARIEAEGLSGGREMFSTVVVAFLRVRLGSWMSTVLFSISMRSATTRVTGFSGEPWGSQRLPGVTSRSGVVHI